MNTQEGRETKWIFATNGSMRSASLTRSPFASGYAQYAALIEAKQAEVSETQQRADEQYELFCKRVRAMEENRTLSTGKKSCQIEPY